jgi:hypothetical protein
LAIELTPLSGRGGKREIKFRIHDEEFPGMERKANELGFRSVNALAAQALRQHGTHDVSKVAARMGEAAEVLHDIRAAAHAENSPISPDQVKIMVRTWEGLCDALIAELRKR